MIDTNIGVGNCPVKDGYVTLNETLNDYPKLTVVEYTNNSPALATGSTFSFFGISFVLESISVESCPIPGFERVVTYEYIHKSKDILEYPINIYDFVQSKKSEAVKETQDSYYFSIGTLIGWASSKVSGGVSVHNFLIPLSKTPSPEETATLKEFIDDFIQRKGLVYQFQGASVSTASIGSGGGISSTIVSNYTIGKSAVPTYRDTILNWSKKNDYESNNLLKKKYRRLDINEYLVYEGDYKPHLPPGEDGTGAVEPRDLSIMADNSGVTKSCKITKYKWGQPEVEIIATFGYAHCALELVADPTKPNNITEKVLDALNEGVVSSGNAYQEILTAIKDSKYGYPDDANWANDPEWRLISIKETDYIYQNLNLELNPVVKKEDGTLEPVIIPPEYEDLLKSNLEILIAKKTRGWELKRFAQEDAANWTNGSIVNWLTLDTLISLKDKLVSKSAISKQMYNWMLYSAKINLEQYLYRRIPVWEEVRYAVSPYSRYYKDLDEVDWEVHYLPKKLLGGDSNDETLVPVLFPDPNWTPELMLVSTSRYTSAFGVSGNPNFDPFVRNYYGSNPVTITTGSEEVEITSYNILPSKNTKNTITELHDSYGRVEEVLSGISQGLGIPGTMYTPQPYMTINDYGIKGVNPPNVSPSKVYAPYPSTNRDREDQYTTLISLRVAQDQSFKSYITTQTFSIADGRPPKATIRKPVFDELKAEDESPFENSITYVSSSISNGGNIVPSVSVQSAENLQDALTGARNQLMLSILTSGSSASAQLLWTSIGRSLVNGRVSLPGGNWIIKSCTQTVQASGGVTFAQPIQIEAGMHITPSISSKTVQLTNENTEHSSVKVLINASLPYHLGTPLQEIPANFSRWIK